MIDPYILVILVMCSDGYIHLVDKRYGYKRLINNTKGMDISA